MRANLIRLALGQTHTTSDPKESIIADLGSCISACVRDPVTGIGGMNHFMLPESDTGLSMTNPFSAATIFGNFAMEMLINSVLGMGCPRARLEIKSFGGANLPYDAAMAGTENAEFVMRYLNNAGLQVAASYLGGERVRRIHFHPATGRFRRVFISGLAALAVVEEECKYRACHQQDVPEEGPIRLFS